MAIGPYWSYIAPVARDNLCLNPSFERGTVGVAAIQSATIGSAANEQQFGAWSCTVAPNSNGTSGAAFGTWTAGNGTDYTVSAHVQGVNGVAYMIGVGDSSGLNLLGSTARKGGGTWHRYSYHLGGEMEEQEATYTLPCGPNAPQWVHALIGLAKRAQEYQEHGFQTDAQLTALFNAVHVDMIEWPLGREGQR